MPIPHDCTRQSQLVAYRETLNRPTNSGWFLDMFFRDVRTQDEKLELRDYSRSDNLPLFYTDACGMPNVVKGISESVSLMELTWPTIKAEANITGCDVDDERIAKRAEGGFMPGDIIPVGRQRFDRAFNKQMSALVDGARATHIGEAISVLKTGGYVLPDTLTTDIGTIDFGRDATLSSIDISGTNEDWCNECARPDRFFEAIGQDMSRLGAMGGPIDVIHSTVSWNAYAAHVEREGVKFRQEPTAEFVGSQRTPFLSYNDVQFKGSTNGGLIRHWVTNVEYIDYDGTFKPVLDQGEVLIVSAGGFDGQRIFRTITSDNREELPNGALPMFIYDGLEEYERKCRTFKPWMEEYHLMVPNNVNGAVLARVTTAACEPCVTC